MKRFHLLLAASLLPTAAHARTDGRGFSSVWFVQPATEPLGARTVNDNDFVFRQRLLPPSLVRLRADAIDARSGKVIAAAGTQLFGLVTDGAPIYCLVGVKDASLARSLLIGGGNRQVCLSDTDRDGSLDSHFGVGNAVKGLPNISGRRPKNPNALKPAPFDTLQPSEITINYFVGVQYRGNANPVGNHIFEVNYGTAEQIGSLTKRILHKKSAIPGSMEILGGRFTILATTPQGIRVSVDRPLPPQPFGVLQTTTYRFY